MSCRSASLEIRLPHYQFELLHLVRWMGWLLDWLVGWIVITGTLYPSLCRLQQWLWHWNTKTDQLVNVLFLLLARPFWNPTLLLLLVAWDNSPHSPTFSLPLSHMDLSHSSAVMLRRSSVWGQKIFWIIPLKIFEYIILLYCIQNPKTFAYIILL